MPRVYALSPASAEGLKKLLAEKEPHDASMLMRQGRARSISPTLKLSEFHVQFCASAGTEGKWGVYYSRNALQVNGEAILIDYQEDVGGDYPASWHVPKNLVGDPSEIYINVKISDEGFASAELSASAGVAESGETLYSIILASIEEKNVIQHVEGAIVLGGAGGAAPAPREDVSMFRYDAAAKRIEGGYILAGRRAIAVEPFVNATDGTYSILVSHPRYESSSAVTATIVKNSSVGYGAHGSSETYLPLWVITNGAAAKDLRGLFVVPLWDDPDDE